LVLPNVEDDAVPPDEEHLVGHGVEQRTVPPLAALELVRGVVAVNLETDRSGNLLDELGIVDTRVTVDDRREPAAVALDRRHRMNRALALQLTMPAVAVGVCPDRVAAPDEELRAWVMEQVPHTRLKLWRRCHDPHRCKRAWTPWYGCPHSLTVKPFRVLLEALPRGERLRLPRSPPACSQRGDRSRDTSSRSPRTGARSRTRRSRSG